MACPLEGASTLGLASFKSDNLQPDLTILSSTLAFETSVDEEAFCRGSVRVLKDGVKGASFDIALVLRAGANNGRLTCRRVNG